MHYRSGVNIQRRQTLCRKIAEGTDNMILFLKILFYFTTMVMMYEYSCQTINPDGKELQYRFVQPAKTIPVKHTSQDTKVHTPIYYPD